MAVLSLIWGFFRSGIGKVVAIALAVLGAVALIYRKGRSDQKQKHRVRDLETANEIREKGDRVDREYDEEISGLSDDERRARVLDRLSRRGKLRGR